MLRHNKESQPQLQLAVTSLRSCWREVMKDALELILAMFALLAVAAAAASVLAPNILRLLFG